MVQRAMGFRWTLTGIPLSFLAFVIVVLEIKACSSLNSEGLALLEFRSKINFDPYETLANWNPNDCDPCMWSGVDCLNSNVHTLDLNGQELEGTLTPEIGNLTHLRFLDLSKNHLSGTISPQFRQLIKLEVLDLRDNNLTGTIPAELGGLRSLKILLLQSNSFEGSIPVKVKKLSLQNDLYADEILTSESAGVSCVNRKFGHCIWQNIVTKSKNSDSFSIPIKGTIIRLIDLFPLFKFGSGYINIENSHINLRDSPERDNHVNNNKRRILIEESHSSNLAALSPRIMTQSPSEPFNALPSRSSGSFPTIPNGEKLSPEPPPPLPKPAGERTHHDASNPSSSARLPAEDKSVKVIIGISASASLIVVAAVVFVVCRGKAVKTIGPWKTRLSGQLQKAFVTGVPKLNRAELDTACEDFSNIISTDESSVMMYKGTLSSGVEIAVASTVIASSKDWSKCSELAFRKKIDSLSRVNHKNFVNLIGYCEEQEPFTRMMVFEYAPNGTLFEHLHVEEVEHIDWMQRMRIIMGSAYCLQYMHDLNPPVPHFNLTSKEILLTDDYAAKIADISFWAELVTKSKYKAEIESEHSELPPLADVETNVYSFGILLLEIISGKHTYSEGQGHFKDWAVQYLNDKEMFSYLIDPALKSFKENELDIVCEVIQACIQQDVQQRPTMKDVILKLRQALDIAPESATPKLSPLWWAELEILSAEAA